MSVTPEIVKRQIERFRHHPNFPDATGQAALMRAFVGSCDSDVQVIATADRMERTLKFAPLPSDVWEAIEFISAELARQNEELEVARKQRELASAKPITEEGWWWETCANDPKCPADTRRLLRSPRADARKFAQSQARGINRWLWEHDRLPEYTDEEIKASIAQQVTSNPEVSNPNREEARS